MSESAASVYLAGVAFALGVNVWVWLVDEPMNGIFLRIVLFFLTASGSWAWAGFIIGAALMDIYHRTRRL